MRCVDVGEVARACTCRVMGGERRVGPLPPHMSVASGDYRHRHICELRDMWECLATTRGFVSVRVISEEYDMGSMNDDLPHRGGLLFIVDVHCAWHVAFDALAHIELSTFALVIGGAKLLAAGFLLCQSHALLHWTAVEYERRVSEALKECVFLVGA